MSDEETDEPGFCELIETVLPPVIGKTIYTKMQGVHVPRGCTYGEKTDMSPEEYLGTYFPLSFAEGYNTIYDMLENELIKRMFGDKEAIRLLDIGSGQGGYSLGILWALEENFPGKPVSIIAIDKRKDLLEGSKGYKQIHKYLYENSIYELDTVEFNLEIKDNIFILPREVDGVEWDLVISSKSLNEIAIIHKNTYEIFLKRCESLLDSNGLLIINDINKSLSQDAGPEKPNMTHFVLRKNVKDYLRGNGDINLCFPIPCAINKLSCDFWKCKPFRHYDTISDYRKRPSGCREEAHPSTVITLIFSKRFIDEFRGANDISKQFKVSNGLCIEGKFEESECPEDSACLCNNLYAFNYPCPKYQSEVK